MVPMDVERYLQEAERSVTTVGRVDMLRKQTEKSSPVTDELSLVGWLIEAGVSEIVARQAVESLESDGTTPLLDVRQKTLEQARKLMQATENPQDVPDKKTAEPVKKRTAKKLGTTNEGVVLKSIVQSGLKAGISACDALKKAGWIQSMDAFVS